MAINWFIFSVSKSALYFLYKDIDIDIALVLLGDFVQIPSLWSINTNTPHALQVGCTLTELMLSKGWEFFSDPFDECPRKYFAPTRKEMHKPLYRLLHVAIA